MKTTGNKQYIRVVYHGESNVCGIKKNTTSNDVIRIILGKSVDVRQYDLYESLSPSSHLALDKDMKIWKQVERWGANKYSYSFIIKPVECNPDNTDSQSKSPASRLRLHKTESLVGAKFKKFKTVSNLAILDCVSEKKTMHGFASQKRLKENEPLLQNAKSVSEHKLAAKMMSHLGRENQVEEKSDDSGISFSSPCDITEEFGSQYHTMHNNITATDVQMKFAALKDSKTRFSALHDVATNSIIFHNLAASSVSIDSEMDSFMLTLVDSP